MAKSKISASYDNSAPFYRKLITVGGGVLRPNCILDVKTDKKVGNFLVREGCFQFGGAPGRVREGYGVG